VYREIRDPVGIARAVARWRRVRRKEPPTFSPQSVAPDDEYTVRVELPGSTSWKAGQSPPLALNHCRCTSDPDFLCCPNAPDVGAAPRDATRSVSTHVPIARGVQVPCKGSESSTSCRSSDVADLPAAPVLARNLQIWSLRGPNAAEIRRECPVTGPRELQTLESKSQT
jgi:hypothetical protein